MILPQALSDGWKGAGSPIAPPSASSPGQPSTRLFGCAPPLAGGAPFFSARLFSVHRRPAAVLRKIPLGLVTFERVRLRKAAPWRRAGAVRPLAHARLL